MARPLFQTSSPNQTSGLDRARQGVRFYCRSVPSGLNSADYGSRLFDNSSEPSKLATSQLNGISLIISHIPLVAQTSIATSRASVILKAQLSSMKLLAASRRVRALAPSSQPAPTEVPQRNRVLTRDASISSMPTGAPSRCCVLQAQALVAASATPRSITETNTLAPARSHCSRTRWNISWQAAVADDDEAAKASQSSDADKKPPDLLGGMVLGLSAKQSRGLRLGSAKRLQRTVELTATFQGQIDAVLEGTQLSFVELSTVKRPSLEEYLRLLGLFSNPGHISQEILDTKFVE